MAYNGWKVIIKCYPDAICHEQMNDDVLEGIMSIDFDLSHK